MWGCSIRCDGSSRVDTESAARLFHERDMTGERAESRRFGGLEPGQAWKEIA